MRSSPRPPAVPCRPECTKYFFWGQGGAAPIDRAKHSVASQCGRNLFEGVNVNCQPMPASGSPPSLAEKHFRELFSEADARLRAVRIGDAPSMQEAAKALALAEDISVDTLASDSSNLANPHFSEMLRFVEAVKSGDMTDEDPATHQYDTILAASLKVMLREAMFAKDGLKRQAYMSRVHEWFEANSGSLSAS